MNEKHELVDLYNKVFEEKLDMLTLYETTMRLNGLLDIEICKLKDEIIINNGKLEISKMEIDDIKYTLINTDFGINQMNTPELSCKDMVSKIINELKELKIFNERLKNENNKLKGEIVDIMNMLTNELNCETINKEPEIEKSSLVLLKR